MERESLMPVMIGIGVATPVLAGLIALRVRSGAVAMPRPSRMWMLALAGPLNLLIWVGFNRHLDWSGSRSIVGILVAIAVFTAMGAGFGFLRGRFARVKPPEDKAKSGDKAPWSHES